MPDVSIVIVNYNTCELLDQCLASIHARTLRVRFEVVVVDNQSTDSSRQMLREKYPDVLVIANEENVGFGRANNQGVARSRAPFVMLLNSDTRLLQDTGSELVAFLPAHPEAGAVGLEPPMTDSRVLASASVLVGDLYQVYDTSVTGLTRPIQLNFSASYRMPADASRCSTAMP